MVYIYFLPNHLKSMRKILQNKISIFLLSPFLIFAYAAYLLAYKFNFIYGDSLSRTFHAYSVFFGNMPKLSAIGFVEPPLPTIVQLPLVLIKPLDANGFAGNISSALFMAVASFYLYKIFSYFKIIRPYKILLVGCFITNPMILFYGANGMSEAAGIASLLITMFYSLVYYKTKNIIHLFELSLFLSLSILTRFEMISLVPVYLCLLTLFLRRQTRKIAGGKLEAVIILYLAPVVFTISIWLLINFLIMHDPFYFMHSAYSNSAQTRQLITHSIFFASLVGNIGDAFVYVIQRVFFIYPAFFVLLIILSLLVRKNIPIILTITLPAIALIIIHTVFLYKGQSFGWLRFFIYAIPCALIFEGFLLSCYKRKAKTSLITVIILFLLNGISSISTVYAMANPIFGREEHDFTQALIFRDRAYITVSSTYREIQLDKKIAAYITTAIYDGKVLIDDFTGFGIVYFTQDSHKYVETIDTNFPVVVNKPLADTKVKYILVHDANGVGGLDAINKRYPHLFESGLSFTTLKKDFGQWRLYKIIR